MADFVNYSSAREWPRISSLGRRALSIFVACYELVCLVTGAFASFLAVIVKGRLPVVQVFLKQIYFTGNEAFRVIMVIAVAVGIAIIAQMSSVADEGRGSLIGKVFVWIVIREIGPLITALVVIARSGSAIAIEIGQMKLNGEIEYLEALGIPGEHYLLMPRILGAGVALFVLNIYFDLLATFSGLFVAWLSWHIPLSLIKQGIVSVLSLQELLISSLKSAIFGVAIAAVSCRAGLNVGESVTHIPQAGTKAVIQAMVIVFVVDLFISLLFIF